MADNSDGFEAVSLANVADGELDRQFGECVTQVIEAFDEPFEYEPSGHQIKCKVAMVVEFSKSLETGAVLVGVRAAFTPPKRRAAMRAAFVRDGEILVEQAMQGTLLDSQSNVTNITKAADGGGDENNE
jgi:hypothetical protein